VHCDDAFDERAVVKKMVSANVNYIRPFVGEVEETKYKITLFRKQFYISSTTSFIWIILYI
jgi:hypothetical protein